MRDRDRRFASPHSIARALARASTTRDRVPTSLRAFATTSRASTRAHASIDDVEKMNSRAHLTAHLDRLRADARLLHARARGDALDGVAVDPCAIAAERLFRDAVARALVADAETTLRERRARNDADARRLATGVRAFATAVEGFDETKKVRVWNVPTRVRDASVEAVTMKMRVLMRVELGARERRRADEDDNDDEDDDDDEETTRDATTTELSPTRDDDDALTYSCDALVYPRRMMTQCRLWRAAAETAADAFNAEHARASAQRSEILERVRGIRRNVDVARASLCEMDGDFDGDDALMTWWDAFAFGVGDARDQSSSSLETLASRLARGLGVDDDTDDDDETTNTVRTRVTAVDATHPDATSAARATATLRAMMGDDVVDDAGDVDVEACDDRRARLDRASDAFAIIPRPDFLTASDDERDEEEVRKTRALDAERSARLAEYKNALKSRARARDARRSALRGEIRRLVREVKELTTAFDDALETLARRRRETEFETSTREAARARAARRLHERFLRGDFGASASDEADAVRVANAELSRALDAVGAYAATMEASKRTLETATRAVNSAARAFRRDARDEPASRVHVDALVALYHTADAVAREKTTTNDVGRTSVPVAVFPQGLDDRWWDKLTSARRLRRDLERELADARATHERTVRHHRALESTVRDARQRADACATFARDARDARRRRARDVDCVFALARRRVEIPPADVPDAVCRGDATLVSRRRIDALNASIRASLEAKTRAESANAVAQRDIDRAKWELQTLRLRREDVVARTTETALLRVSKRLQRHFRRARDGNDATVNIDGRDDETSRPGARRRSGAADAARDAETRVAELHEEKMRRRRRALESVERQIVVARRKLRLTRRELEATA